MTQTAELLLDLDPLTPPAVAPEVAFQRATDLLERHFGYPAFRGPQERVIRSVLSGRDTLGVLPTGAGKSVCFQIPALLRPGLTVVISPLIALMEDQVTAARRRGIPAWSLTSVQPRTARREALEALGSGTAKLLYVAPERCASLAETLARARVPVGLLAVDEAHCIAEWGFDFRPAYLQLAGFRRRLGRPPVVALTGSATPGVRSQIAAALELGSRGGYDLVLGSFDRRNLHFAVESVKSERDRLARLLGLIERSEPIALVYAPTRNLAEAIARVVRQRGRRAAVYHAGLTKERRALVLQQFLADELDVVAATCAFGMGIDKPNVRLVVHWTPPPTPESYYQEAGRAGRDGQPSRCVLLYRKTDGNLPRRELEVTFPPRATVLRAWREPAFKASLPRNLQLSVERLRRELWSSGAPGDWRRIERRRQTAVDRIVAMEHYAERRRCRRAALLEYFGERLARCRGCDVCAGP